MGGCAACDGEPREDKEMILQVVGTDRLPAALDEIGLRAALRTGSALIKVNLAHPPEPGHPRTDPTLLAEVIQYVMRAGALCAVAEGADGFLMQNLERIGLDALVRERGVKVIDFDLEKADRVVVDGEEHHLPRCLRDYGVRIGIPATSKRPGMTFSNNVKLFVGAVPRRMYQVGKPQGPRPRIHVDLHRSIASVYQAVMVYAPFGFFVNGGRAMVDDRGEFELSEILVGDDGLVAWLSLVLFLIHTQRLRDWHTPGIWRKPLLWSLYVGYGFLVLGFLMKALSVWWGISPFLALHAFAYGGIGLTTLGMMSRVALGHTGRSVFDPPRLLAPAFTLIVVGALIRVVVPIFDAFDYRLWIAASQVLWVVGFGAFAAVYIPILIRPRVDGRRG